MLDLFRHLRIHTQKKPKEEPEEMDFPEMYLMGLGATTELPDNFKRKKKMQCYHCESELTWGGDHDIEEEFDHVDAQNGDESHLSKLWDIRIGLHTEVTF